MKVIFLDIDGTLVDYDMKVSESAMLAIEKTIKKGNKVYLTTGRTKAEIYPYLWDSGINGIIGGNGMYIEDNGQTVMDVNMDYYDEKEVVEWLIEKDLSFFVESNNGLFASRNFKKRVSDKLFNGDEDRTNLVFPFMNYKDEKFVREDVLKISFLLEKDVIKEARKKFDHKLKVSTWTTTGKGQEFGEFAVKGIDKMKAIYTLLDHLHIDVKDTFAFGDSMSDIEMIKYCNIGVAMGNAEETVKEVADFVTDNVNEDGVYNAFKRFELI